MVVEKALDELWIGVKGLSNSEIAGSRRNALRCSVVLLNSGGRDTDWLRGLTGLPTPTKLRIPLFLSQQ